MEQFSPSLLVRWEEEKYEDGVKWKFLEHKGPYFPPEYQPLPGDVHFYYGEPSSVSLVSYIPNGIYKH